MKTPIKGRPAAVLVAALLLASSGLHAEVLGAGYSMHPGQHLYSGNKQHFAMLQADGNFAVYTASGRTTWATGTAGSGAVKATMQRDGNFVLHDAAGNAVWKSGTRGRHRMFGVANWGSAVILNARKWKPWNKSAEPFVEDVLKRRGKLDWQSPSSGSTAPHRRAAANVDQKGKGKVRKP
ncbi:hypothetical protein [Luteibacter yeojuensis]|uniref:hypothetical protein n=1 Tax=Luteibacter yeojuensis TaxID=345309 RepID=UPI0006964827|nr:hypothetical protein [Luteibacter yeojuensis]